MLYAVIDNQNLKKNHSFSNLQENTLGDTHIVQCRTVGFECTS